MEDKQKICDALCAALQITDEYYDLIGLDYIEESEIVVASFRGGKKVANVAGDNGAAMIRDVLRAIR